MDAVNLVDDYWRELAITPCLQLFAADGGVYVAPLWWQLACYALGIVVQIPFMATDFSAGPSARAPGGVSLSWLVGPEIVAGVYSVSAPPVCRAPGRCD